MLNTLLILWFVIAALSVVYVAWDAFRHNPELVVMKWAGWYGPGGSSHDGDASSACRCDPAHA